MKKEINTALNISNIRAPKGKIIVRQLQPDDLNVDGIIIPATKKISSNEAVIVSIGEMEKDKVYYHDCEIDQYRRQIFKVGDIVLLNFVSQVSMFTAYDENNDTKTYITVSPETINAVYKDGQFFKTLN